MEGEIKNDSEKQIEADPFFDISSMAVNTGVNDPALEHDHYLYGIPKRRRLISPCHVPELSAISQDWSCSISVV
jgi:hypothetical protein